MGSRYPLPTLTPVNLIQENNVGEGRVEGQKEAEGRQGGGQHLWETSDNNLQGLGSGSDPPPREFDEGEIISEQQN